MKNRVQQLEAKWEKEKLGDLLKRELAMQRIESMEAMLERLNGVTSAIPSAVPGTGKPLFDVAPPPGTCPGELFTGLLELALSGAATVASFAVVIGALPEGLVFLPLAAVATNMLIVNIEKVTQGYERPCEQMDIDYLPLVHVFFPDFMSNRSRRSP